MLLFFINEKKNTQGNEMVSAGHAEGMIIAFVRDRCSRFMPSRCI